MKTILKTKRIKNKVKNIEYKSTTADNEILSKINSNIKIELQDPKIP